MKLAKNMILIKDSYSAAFKVNRKKATVTIDYYKNTRLTHKEHLSLDKGSEQYYILLDTGYREAF